MTRNTERRLARLHELWPVLGVNPRDHSNSAGEDAHSVEERALDHGDDILRFLAVTYGQGQSGRRIVYAHSTFLTWQEAKEHTVVNVNDPDYPEHPLRIIDLDTNASWVPEWSGLCWKPAPMTDAANVKKKRTSTRGLFAKMTECIDLLMLVTAEGKFQSERERVQMFKMAKATREMVRAADIPLFEASDKLLDSCIDLLDIVESELASDPQPNDLTSWKRAIKKGNKAIAKAQSPKRE